MSLINPDTILCFRFQVVSIYLIYLVQVPPQKALVKNDSAVIFTQIPRQKWKLDPTSGQERKKKMSNQIGTQTGCRHLLGPFQPFRTKCDKLNQAFEDISWSPPAPQLLNSIIHFWMIFGVAYLGIHIPNCSVVLSYQCCCAVMKFLSCLCHD